MGALHDAHDAAFGAALAGVGRELDQNLIALHGLGDVEGRDEDITLEALANLAIGGTEEAEAVTMHGESTDDEIAVDGGGCDSVPVARDEDELAAHHEIGKEGLELLALAATQGEFADELFVSGGALGLGFDVLEQIAFRDHSSLL
jgi:hypothetical protein